VVHLVDLSLTAAGAVGVTFAAIGAVSIAAITIVAYALTFCVVPCCCCVAILLGLSREQRHRQNAQNVPVQQQMNDGEEEALAQSPIPSNVIYKDVARIFFSPTVVNYVVAPPGGLAVPEASAPEFHQLLQDANVVG
jgi:hypothetical protein